ncbi:MAG: hypothetical protein K0U12_06365 [Gammaproteobacteria bacterium]|nr:hypothetical protein [Gammaproteobacteria bacterium]
MPGKIKNFSSLLFAAIKSLWSVLMSSIWLIIFAVIVKDAYLYLGGLPSNEFVKILLLMVMIVLGVGLWAAILYQANYVLKKNNPHWKLALRFVAKHWRAIYGCAGLYFIIIVAVFGVVDLVGRFGMHVWGRDTAAVFLSQLIGAIVLLNLLGLTWFGLLIVIRGESNPLRAVLKSYKVTVTKFRHIIGLYAVLVATIVLLDPASLHSHFFAGYHVLALFDFAVMAISLPLIANLTVLLWQDMS